MTPTSLDGIRVLDLSRVLAGPWCTQTLADLGADVIKIERAPSDSHPGGDDTRAWGPPYLPEADGSASRESAYYLGANRNKRSVALDIATPEGQATLRAILKHCQVLVENFKVGDLKRYGLDYETLKAEFPALVYCSITGFGQTGPYAHRAGYDYAVQGMGGLMSVTGERDDLGGGPQKVGVAVADLFTGLYATVGILAAVRHAERTGQGQHIDMALLDTQVAMLANLGANCLVSGQVPGRAGNAHQNIVPYQVFEVAAKPDGSADHIIVAVGNDGQFAKFGAIAVGFDPAAATWARDPAYAKNSDRVKRRAALVPLIEESAKRATKQQWLNAMEAAGVPGGPINNLGEVFSDPHVAHRGMVGAWDHSLKPDLRLVASPLKMSATPPVKRRAPPKLGEHTEEVLKELGITFQSPTPSPQPLNPTSSAHSAASVPALLR